MPWLFLSLFVVHIVLNVFYRNKSVSMQCFTIKTKTHITLGNVFDDDDDDERSRNFHYDGLGLEIREKQRKKVRDIYIYTQHRHLRAHFFYIRPCIFCRLFWLLISPFQHYRFSNDYARFGMLLHYEIEQASKRGHAVAICLC